ncbi:hypothetical protein [[Mycobacterium] nativiensis]|uniref:Uncharacterized protein n=1 Tax=[Mycobacterium] nativiensis TaxID=2855503 RepID=A0ABU5XSA3_9MYCO|nr:hypothetical protein [Mycolicibacter sp. MYC340]MEB3030381.1 hypothetical protein [Mycolicibacter sp. MYC340]
MIFQPLPSIPADAGFIEHLLGRLGNRIQRGLPGGVGRVVLLADHALHCGELFLDRLLFGQDLFDSVVARLRDSRQGCTQLRHRVDNALIGLALVSTVLGDVQQLLFADRETRHHVFGGISLV